MKFKEFTESISQFSLNALIKLELNIPYSLIVPPYLKMPTAERIGKIFDLNYLQFSNNGFFTDPKLSKNGNRHGVFLKFEQIYDTAPPNTTLLQYSCEKYNVDKGAFYEYGGNLFCIYGLEGPIYQNAIPSLRNFFLEAPPDNIYYGNETQEVLRLFMHEKILLDNLNDRENLPIDEIIDLEFLNLLKDIEWYTKACNIKYHEEYISLTRIIRLGNILSKYLVFEKLFHMSDNIEFVNNLYKI